MKLKFYRIESGRTQKEVATYLGIAESTYNLYENEKRKIGFEDLLKLGELYGCTVDDLLNGTKKAVTHADDGLNDEEQVLIRLFRILPAEHRAAIIRRLQELERLQKAQDDLLQF